MRGYMSSKTISGAEKLKVLLVDDNLMSKTLTMSIMENFGFKDMDYSINGLEAWERMSALKEAGGMYDIVLLDWNMPVMSGYDLLRRCREDASLNNMAIIMVTAENQKRNVLEAVKAGATSYITKPVIAEDLFFKLSQVMDWKNNKSCAV